MGKQLHRTIPIFIPEQACPARCVYCNQYLISGHSTLPTTEEVRHTIEQYLSTIAAGSRVEVGFFGGTFTALTAEVQYGLLSVVQPYLKRGSVQSVRLSTRPDYIEQDNLAMLCDMGVQTVELGVQSLDDEVLRTVERGYDSARVAEAARCVTDAGLRLGMQMMVGLPGDTPAKSMLTAQKFVEWGAEDVRIYPTLVIEHTRLAHMYRRGAYAPLTLQQAVEWVSPLLCFFEEKGLHVLRVGLHPTKGFINGEDYLAGPFHVAFKDLVRTAIFRDELEKYLAARPELAVASELTVWVAEGYINAAVGHGATNKRWLMQTHRKVVFREQPSLHHYQVNITTS
ncbi:MAG: radical SAM protein [Bacteroidales bacterium]|nr:radical SAM protein [Bacteroidales bacterium]